MLRAQWMAVVAVLPLLVVLAECCGAEPPGSKAESPGSKIEQGAATGKITVRLYHCERRDSCQAFCVKDEVLVGGGCAVEKNLEGRGMPALQNAWIKKQEHT